MAWENASINEINLGIDEGNTYWKSQSSSDSISQQSDFAGLTTNPVIPNNEFSTKFLIGDAQLGLRLYVSNSMCEWQPYKNGNAILPNLLSSPQPNSYYTMGVTLFIGYNDAIQEGQLMVKYYQDVGDPRYNQWTLKMSFTNYIEIYNWVKDMMNAYPIITYNWQSVPSISGKLGVINFTRIKEEFINDGSAVTGAPKTNFENLKKANRVSALIDDVLPEPTPSGTDVTVKYKVALAPSGGTYTYCKLVIKKNKSPNSATDGDKIIDLDPSETSIVVSNLIGETKYYFTIFTKDVNNVEGVSESKHITTGKGITYEFGFTGEIQTFQVPKSGKWKIEAWGAQGGSVSGARGGYGAYSAGEMQLSAGQVLYIGVGGQNGFNGGGNYVEDGNIVNAGVHGSGQAIIYTSNCWTEDYGGRDTTTQSDFVLSGDALDSLMYCDIEVPQLLWEKNDIKLYGVRDARNSTWGGQYRYSFFMRNQNDELVFGDPNVAYTYAEVFSISGFDRRNDYYNSNVWDRLQKIGLAFGVDYTTQQGYVTICAKEHCGYYQGGYPNYDWYRSIYGKTSGDAVNRAKLYDALIRASS